MSDSVDKNRKKDKSELITRNSHVYPTISLEQIKSLYIAEGLDASEISVKIKLPISEIQNIIESHNLPALRKEYVTEGLKAIQNIQIQQSQQLLDLETDFKRMRIIQLQSELEQYAAYYKRHGDFYKRHPLTGEILKDNNGIAMQIYLPNVSKELTQLKDSVTLSEGLKQVLNRIDEIINYAPKKENIKDNSVTAEYSEIFGSDSD